MKKAIKYSVLVCAVSWMAALVFYLVTGYTGYPSGDIGTDTKNQLSLAAFSALYMFFPLICALLLQIINRDDTIQSGRKSSFRPASFSIGKYRPDFSRGLLKFKPRWSWVAGCLLVPCIIFIGILANGLFADISFSGENMQPEIAEALAQQTGGMSYGLFILITIISGLFAGVTINAVVAFGEEYGWRYYMVEALRDVKFLKAALFIGTVWGLWHFPIILMGHNYPVHRVEGVFMMCAMCILFGIIEMYFVVKSRSVYPAAIIHGTLNALAGLSTFMVKGGNDLLNGMPGVSGCIAMSAAIAGIFVYDCYISRDNILTSTLAEGLDRE